MSGKFRQHLALIAFVFILAAITPTLAQNVSCRDVLKACQRWCYAERSGPERFHCKGNCQSQFNSSLSSGVFRREDGAEIECQAMPNVAWKAWPQLSSKQHKLSALLYSPAN